MDAESELERILTQFGYDPTTNKCPDIFPDLRTKLVCSGQTLGQIAIESNRLTLRLADEVRLEAASLQDGLVHQDDWGSVVFKPQLLLSQTNMRQLTEALRRINPLNPPLPPAEIWASQPYLTLTLSIAGKPATVAISTDGEGGVVDNPLLQTPGLSCEARFEDCSFALSAKSSIPGHSPPPIGRLQLENNLLSIEIDQTSITDINLGAGALRHTEDLHVAIDPLRKFTELGLRNLAMVLIGQNLLEATVGEQCYSTIDVQDRSGSTTFTYAYPPIMLFPNATAELSDTQDSIFEINKTE